MSFYSTFADYYEQVFPFRDAVYGFLKEHAGPGGSRVLDAGCGPGHYCGRFASDGFQACGIDLDEAMIRAAKARYPEASFSCLDIRAIASTGSGFSLVWSIGNVLAHLKPDELADCISGIYGMLSPGGRWVMQVMNWEPLLDCKAFRFPEKMVRADERICRFSRAYTAIGEDAVTFSFSLTSGSEVLFEERLTLYPSTAEKILHDHRDAGFLPVGSYSDYEMSPVRDDPGSGLVMVFRKP